VAVSSDKEPKSQVDTARASSILNQLNATSDSLRGLYERLPRYIVSPLTRDDIVRRDDLVLEIEEIEAKRAALVRALLAAMRE
jgi:hypothetical protein